MSFVVLAPCLLAINVPSHVQSIGHGTEQAQTILLLTRLCPTSARPCKSSGSGFAVQGSVRSSFAQSAVLALFAFACGVPQPGDEEGETYSAITIDREPGGDSTGSCGGAALINFDTDYLHLIAVAGDWDAFRFNSTAEARTYKIRSTPPVGKQVECELRRWNGTSWYRVGYDPLSASCVIDYPASTVQQFCVRVTGTNGSADFITDVGKLQASTCNDGSMSGTDNCSPWPHYGCEANACKPSCGVLGGNVAPADPCENHGWTDMGDAYDVPYCCRQ
jgi:hypothetical protein